MKTDSIFYRLFQTLPEAFFELIGQPSEAANNYQFRSEEVKQTSFRIDGLFLPTSSSDEQPIYFVEVQFQPDTELYWRFFGEIFVYLRRNQPNRDWYGVLVYKQRSIEQAVPRPYRWLMETPHIRRVYLDELGASANESVGLAMVQLVVEEERTAEAQAKKLIRKAQQEFEDEAKRREVLELIETNLGIQV